MSIIEQNSLRNFKLDQPYYPLTGEGSSLDRELFTLTDLNEKLYLPLSMVRVPWIMELNECGSMQKYIKKSKNPIFKGDHALEIVNFLFSNERLDHDFEFWAALCIKITHKDTFKKVDFVLRGAQRKLLSELEAMRLANLPIRIVLLKARQWGGSTLVEFYMMWIQNRHRKNWHMAVVSQDDNASKNISEMYSNAALDYPLQIGTITLKSYARSSKNRICQETGGIIGIGSVNNPDQFRSYNYAMAHLSECGVWQDTPKRSAAKLVTSIKEAVPDQPYTVVVEESTANGLNYFYDSWLKAQQGNTRYKAVFIPWYEIDRCRIEVKDPQVMYKSLSDYEKFQWGLGATLEGIAWYRSHKADKGYDDWQMFQENPSTAEEAFQSTGQKVFAPIYINALRLDNRPAPFIGEVYAQATSGVKALEDIAFSQMVNGNLKIWSMPDSDNSYSNRYVVVVDIGGRTEKADNSIIRVFDRIGMLKDGYIEGVLTWSGHTDQDLLAWKAVQISIMYDNALLVIESNSLKKEQEGDHFLTILDQIKDFYRNLYIRNDQEKVGSEFVPRYGFHTNSKSKTLAIDAFNSVARERFKKITDSDDGYYLIERDSEVCNEASYFETKPNGSQGAVQGKRDDRLIVTAIGSHICINHLELPSLKRIEQQRKQTIKRTESNF